MRRLRPRTGCPRVPSRLPDWPRRCCAVLRPSRGRRGRGGRGPWAGRVPQPGCWELSVSGSGERKWSLREEREPNPAAWDSTSCRRRPAALRPPVPPPPPGWTSTDSVQVTGGWEVAFLRRYLRSPPQPSARVTSAGHREQHGSVDRCSYHWAQPGSLLQLLCTLVPQAEVLQWQPLQQLPRSGEAQAEGEGSRVSSPCGPPCALGEVPRHPALVFSGGAKDLQLCRPHPCGLSADGPWEGRAAEWGEGCCLITFPSCL